MREDDLIAIDDACRKEIAEHLYPEGLIFSLNILQGSAHRRDSHEAPYAEGGREEPRNALPEARHVALRPADAY